jgi:hypothetical protein
MSARSTPAPAAVQAQPAGKPDRALRRLRQLCLALAVVCAAALLFELGVLPTPNILPARPTATLKILSVHNDPRTAVVGRTEKFSVRLAGVSNTWLTYVLKYPDGRVDSATVRADVSGYSSHTFRVIGYQLHHFREPAQIGVKDSSGRLRAVKLFAIQQRQ